MKNLRNKLNFSVWRPPLFGSVTKLPTRETLRPPASRYSLGLGACGAPTNTARRKRGCLLGSSYDPHVIPALLSSSPRTAC